MKEMQWKLGRKRLSMAKNGYKYYRLNSAII